MKSNVVDSEMKHAEVPLVHRIWLETHSSTREEDHEDVHEEPLAEEEEVT